MSDEKPPVEKAVELFVYAPVGMALYVRDMLPSMVGIFVARGKREVQSHRAPPPPPPPVPPVPPEVKRRIDESVGMAKVVAEGGFGVARDVAGSGLGVARDVAGSALAQFLAMRANGTEPAPPPPPPPRDAAPEPAGERGTARRHARAGHGTRRSSRRRVADRGPGIGRAADSRLRRALGVTGGRAARRPRPRFARRDPPLRDRPPRPQHDPRQDRAALLTWSRAGRRRPRTSLASWSWRA